MRGDCLLLAGSSLALVHWGIDLAFLAVQNPFQRSEELDGLSKTLVDLPKTALYVGALVLVAASGALGSLLGTKAPGTAVGPPYPTCCLRGTVRAVDAALSCGVHAIHQSQMSAKHFTSFCWVCAESMRNAGRLAGAALGAAASAVVVGRLQGKRVEAGGVLLYNAVASRDDPTTLTREEVQAIGDRWACLACADASDSACWSFMRSEHVFADEVSLSFEVEALHWGRVSTDVYTRLLMAYGLLFVQFEDGWCMSMLLECSISPELCVIAVSGWARTSA